MSKKISKEIAEKARSPRLKKEPGSDAHKEQGEKANSKLTDGGGRGIFAYAVGAIMEEAKNKKGSQSAFLGVESKVLDPKENSPTNNMLTKCKRK